MTTSVDLRQVLDSRASSTESGNESSGEAGRVRMKSAVVMASGRRHTKQRSSSSSSSSISRTPSPLPHAKFPTHRRSPPPLLRHRPPPSPSPPPSFNKRERERAQAHDWRRRERAEEGELREEEQAPPPKKTKEDVDPLLTRTGGAYIPPAKLRLLQQQIEDKSSVAYQRLSWEALKKSINGLINKVNVSNIGHIVQELFQENVVRGRGLLARSIIQAQTASPTFTHVYAALVAIINTKFPHIGELLSKRLILQFKRSFRRNNKAVCVTATKFLAHLVNQLVLHEIVALELLTLLLEEPTDDSVEVAIGMLKECGLKLEEVSNRAVIAVFDSLRSILNSAKVSPRVQYMIEVMFAIRKDKFKEHPIVLPDLDLVQEDDQFTHLMSLTDDYDGEEILNIFQKDTDYLDNEEKYKQIKAEILGEGSSGSEEGSGDESDDEEEDEEDEDGENEVERMDITDKTDAKVLSLRRTIYLTIMSSLDYQECAHKLMKTKEDGQEPEIATMIVECCGQERSYLRFFGLLGQRFCLLNKLWVEAFDFLFQEQYATVHRLETNKLRNVAKFFAQLFYSDALPWTAMSCMHLNEEETNSSSRIFVKILFQELSEFMGIKKLNERLRDPVLSEAFEGLMPRDHPKNTRFAINFFTSIGLGGLTDDLREHLKNVQKQIMAQKQDVSSSDTDSDSSEQDSSDSSSGNSEEEEESSEDTEEERRRRRMAKTDRGKERKQRERGHDEDTTEERRDRRGRDEEEERGRERRKRSSSEESESRDYKRSRYTEERREEAGERKEERRRRSKEEGRVSHEEERSERRSRERKRRDPEEEKRDRKFKRVEERRERKHKRRAEEEDEEAEERGERKHKRRAEEKDEDAEERGERKDRRRVEDEAEERRKRKHKRMAEEDEEAEEERRERKDKRKVEEDEEAEQEKRERNDRRRVVEEEEAERRKRKHKRRAEEEDDETEERRERKHKRRAEEDEEAEEERRERKHKRRVEEKDEEAEEERRERKDRRKVEEDDEAEERRKRKDRRKVEEEAKRRKRKHKRRAEEDDEEAEEKSRHEREEDKHYTRERQRRDRESDGDSRRKEGKGEEHRGRGRRDEERRKRGTMEIGSTVLVHTADSR